MRVRQKELRRTRKRLEERKKLAAKGIAITGTGVVTAPVAQKISRPVSRRASETTPAPRPQNDRGPRRDGPRDGGPRGDRREYGNDRGPRRDGPRDERPRDTPGTDAPAPVEATTAPVETTAPATEATEAPATTTEG